MHPGCLTTVASRERCDTAIVFAIPPNSAASERVFAMLENMVGSDQIQCLAYYIQAALMLRYNNTTYNLYWRRRIRHFCPLTFST